MKGHGIWIFGALALFAIICIEKKKTVTTPATGGTVGALPTISSEASVTFQDISSLIG